MQLRVFNAVFRPLQANRVETSRMSMFPEKKCFVTLRYDTMRCDTLRYVTIPYDTIAIYA